MSNGPPKAVVSRRFEGQEKACKQALKFLLQKRCGPAPAPEDARKESEDVSDN